MLLVVGGIKGGSGKTTIATNLCQMRSYEGFKVLLIDADDQKSSYDWSVQRDEIGLGLASLKTKSKPFVTVCMSGTSGKSIYANILKMLSDYDDIIVDAGGRNTESQRAALSLADKFLLPFKPSSIDIWTIGQVDRLLNDCVNPKLKTYAVVNQGDYKGSDNQSAMSVIQESENIECLPITIGNRKAFRNAAANGLGVFELNPPDEKAKKEMLNLYKKMYK